MGYIGKEFCVAVSHITVITYTATLIVQGNKEQKSTVVGLNVAAEKSSFAAVSLWLMK